MPEPTYYFAYGSNLHRDQMRARCPGSKPFCRLTVLDMRLVFRGVADVELARGQSVPGVVYTITEADELALDRYEGYRKDAPARGLYRKEFITFEVDGKPARAMYYKMNRSGQSVPSEFYYDTIAAGYAHFGMDSAPLEAALMRAWDAEQAEYDLEDMTDESEDDLLVGVG